MKFTEYISTTHVFTTADLLAALDSKVSAATQLNRALASGAIERVRRGLYVSRTGRFTGAAVDPFEVAAALDGSSVLSYHSALEAHGIAHSVGFTCSFRTSAARSPFSFAGVSYVPYPRGADVRTQGLRGASSARCLVTDKEQTALDCLKHPGRAGGIEEVLRSLAAFRYLDARALAALAAAESASMAARAGWLLEARREAWEVPGDALLSLEASCAGVASKMDPGAGQTQGWSKRWQMRLPAPEEEMLQWVS